MSDSKCQETLNQVFEFMSGDLEEESRKAVLDHLSDCESCTKEYAVEAMISNLISSSSIEAKSSFASKIQSRLQSEI